MDINDYNTRLSQARDGYHEKAKELKDNYERQLSDVEERNNVNETNQKKAYSEARNRLEQESSRMSEEQVRSSQQELARLQDDFVRTREKERVDFERESGKKRTEFTNRLSDIQEGYYDSARRADHSHQNQLTAVKSNLENRIENNEIAYNKSLQDIQRDSDLKYDDFKNNSAQEKRQLLKEQSNSMNNVIENNNKRAVDIAEKARRGMEESQRVHDEKSKNLLASHEQNREELKNNYNNSQEQLLTNFQDRMGEIDRQNAVNDTRAAEDTKRLLRNQERRFTNEIDMEKRRVDAITNNGGRGNAAKVELDTAKKMHEERVDKLKTVMADQSYQHQIDKEKNWQKSVDAMRENSKQHQKLMENREKLNAEYNTKQLEKNRTEKEALVHQYGDELIRKEKFHNEQLIDNHNKDQAQYDTLRNTLGSQINYLQEKNVETIAEIQKSNAKEKTDFIEQAKRDLHDSKEDLKDDLSFKFQKVAASYEKKIAGLEQENKMLTTHYEERMNNIKNKTAEEIEQTRLLESQRKQLDARNYKRALENKDRENDLVVSNIRREYDKKLTESKHHNELQMAKMIERYEGLLKVQDQEHKKDLNLKLSESREHYDRLYQTAEIEKESLRSMYELKIQKLKQANERAWEVQKMRMASTSNGSGESEA